MTKNIIIGLLILTAFIVGGIAFSTTKTEEVCPKDNDWKQLKLIDDEGFNLAAESFSITGEMIEAESTGNATALREAQERFRDNTEKIVELAQTRKEVLKKLGYE